MTKSEKRQVLENNQKEVDKRGGVSQTQHQINIDYLNEMLDAAFAAYGEEDVYVVPFSEWPFQVQQDIWNASKNENENTKKNVYCVYKPEFGRDILFRSFKLDEYMFERMKHRYEAATGRHGERTFRFFFMCIDKSGDLIGDWTASKCEADFSDPATILF